MQIDVFKKIIDELKNNIFYLTLYFQGEPYLNNEIFEMIKYARNAKILVATSTNGHFLNPENAVQTINSGLNTLIISVDGTNQEIYSVYRKGGTYATVVDGILELVRQKKILRSSTPEVIVQFIVFRQNENQIAEIKKLGKEWGVDEVQIKTAQLYNYEHGNELMPLNQKFSRYNKVKDNGSVHYKIKNHLPDHCWRMWSSAVFTWEGVVVPCCYDKDADFNFGNIKDQMFKEIWRSEEYDRLRNKILNSRKSIGICCNCDQKL